MTFRQFAILMVRLQAIWLFFYSALTLTYLLDDISLARGMRFPLSEEPALRRAMFWLVVRLLLHVAAGFALIVYAERFLSWLVKDSVQKQQPEEEMTGPKLGSGQN